MDTVYAAALSFDIARIYQKSCFFPHYATCSFAIEIEDSPRNLHPILLAFEMGSLFLGPSANTDPWQDQLKSLRLGLLRPGFRPGLHLGLVQGSILSTYRG